MLYVPSPDILIEVFEDPSGEPGLLYDVGRKADKIGYVRFATSLLQEACPVGPVRAKVTRSRARMKDIVEADG